MNSKLTDRLIAASKGGRGIRLTPDDVKYLLDNRMWWVRTSSDAVTHPPGRHEFSAAVRVSVIGDVVSTVNLSSPERDAAAMKAIRDALRTKQGSGWAIVEVEEIQGGTVCVGSHPFKITKEHL